MAHAADKTCNAFAARGIQYIIAGDATIHVVDAAQFEGACRVARDYAANVVIDHERGVFDFFTK